MGHINISDTLPVASVQPLLGVVFRLHALSAYGAWDACKLIDIYIYIYTS